MKFDEKDFETVDNKNLCLIYFLLLDDEVVYVGQTTRGLLRPFSHWDKNFTSVKVKYVEEKYLDAAEDFFIKKYLPKYNKMLNNKMNYTVKSVHQTLKNDYNLKSFNIRKFKKLVEELNIQYYEYREKMFLELKDCCAIEARLRELIEEGKIQ